MSRTGAKLISVLAIVLMGFGFPSILAYLGAVYSFNIWYIGIFTFLSLLGAVAIPAIVLGIDVFGRDEDEVVYKKEARLLKETISMLITRMDHMITELEEIDKILKVEE